MTALGNYDAMKATLKDVSKDSAKSTKFTFDYDVKPETFVKPSKASLSAEDYYLSQKVPFTEGLKKVAKDLEESGPAICDRVAALAHQDGWKDSGVKSGIKLARQEKEKLYRGTIDIEHDDATPEKLLDYLWSRNPCVYDDTLENASRIYTFQDDYPGVCIYWQSHKGQMGFSGREFLLMATRKKFSEDHMVFGSKSVSCPELDSQESLPELFLPGRVRAETPIGGLDIRRVQLANGKFVLRVTYLHGADIKVNVMQMILNQILLNSCMFLATLKEKFTAYLNSLKSQIPN